MTENEAINELLDYVGDAFETTISVETVTLAREALEEIQRQKTKIGMFVTLEERMEISSRFAKLEQYEAIGTIDEFKALKEKNEPKEVAYQIDTSGHKHEKCPVCGSFHVFGKHCTECGQSIVEWWK